MDDGGLTTQFDQSRVTTPLIGPHQRALFPVDLQSVRLTGRVTGLEPLFG